MDVSSAAGRQPIQYPISTPVDDELDAIVRTAAWIGEISRDETFCSFTAFLIALIDGDTRTAALARGPSIDIDAIRRHRQIDQRGVEDARRRALTGALPSGKPMFSISARNMLEAAEGVARQRAGSDAVEVRDLISAYAFHVPKAHEQQMREWGFNPPIYQRDFVRELGQPPIDPPTDEAPVPPAPPRIPGTILARLRFSPGALSVLRSAAIMAQHRRGERLASDFIGTSTLLWAMVELARAGAAPSEATDLVFIAHAVGSTDLRVGTGATLVTTASPQFSTSEALPELSPNVATILERADVLRRSTVAPDAADVCVRHLLAALLLHEDTPRTNAHERLAEAGVDLAALKRRYLEHVKVEWPQDNADAWSIALLGRSAASPGPYVYVATFTSDNPLDQPSQWLEVEEEAHAFARLAASSDVEPPLSIGIFGEWGVGKTFFMDRMMRNVEKIAAEVRRFGAPEGERIFHEGIVQIRFNAWHYIEANLWASLVEFIFDELDRWLRPREEDSTKIDALFDQLATSRQLKLEALQELVFARQQREAAEGRLNSARQAYETALVRQATAAPKAFWEAVASTFADQFHDAAAGEAARRELDAASAQLGIPALRAAGAELQATLKEADTQAGRARVIGRGLLLAFGTKGWWLAGALLIAIIPAGLVMLAQAIAEARSIEWLKQVGSMTLALPAMLAVLTGGVGRATSHARRALDTLQGFRDKLDAAVRKETEKPRADVAEAEREVELRKAAIAQAEQQFAEAEQRVREIKRELESGTARGRLNKFIRDKVVAGDYAKHLGIIATIRKDFDQLARIMDDADDAKVAEEIERLEEEHSKRVEAFIAQSGAHLHDDEKDALRAKTPDRDLRMFRRIILYIDDLDRCPPAKVVEVLQAIHLLLCFKLFIVVVAVDTRWVSHALKTQYRGLLVDAEAGRRRHHEPPASPHDYLEKIFQIPYWVRPMDGRSSSAFVRSLVGDDVGRGGPPAVAPPPPPAVPPAPRLAPDSPPGPRGGERPEILVKPGPVVPLVPPPPVREPQADRKDAPVDPRPETLTITPWEADLMERLAPYLGQSPRRAKRFVNVYRLIKTGLPRSVSNTLIGEGGSSLSYRALLTQLAIVTGAPRTVRRYFAALPAGEAHGESLERFGQRLARDAAIAGSAEWDVVRGAIAALMAFNQNNGGDLGPAMVDALRDVTRIASRYSFIARA